MKKWLPILLILWLAFGLRLFQLTAVPPGLTHDEANHGREAIGILDGILLYYFPLNYGSEPLYSYTAAASMALLGETLFALRYVNVIFGLLAIAATYAWASKLFDRRVGWLTAVLLTISFWPLASSREALRAGMLPFFMLLAIWAFGKIVAKRPTAPAKEYILPVSLFAILIAITLHIYLAARVAWLLFPAFLLYLAIANRPKFRQVWLPVSAGLLLAGLLVLPMFIYLRHQPAAQTRLSMFPDTLGQLASGNIAPLLQRAGQAFLAFFWPGFGDQFLAYNIPGRPTFDLLTGLFFLVGLALVVRFTLSDLRGRGRRPATFTSGRYALLLFWFLAGIIPSLVTGPTASTTRNLAALSVVHMLPAIGFVALADRVKVRWAVWLATAVWLTFALFITSRDYFGRWGQAAEVRGAYQQTVVAELAHLQENPPDGPAVISTVYPGPAHDASIALVLAQQLETRWIDARWGLIVPNGRSPHYIIPHSTPPHPLFATWLQAQESVQLRPDDLDPSFTSYQLDPSQLQAWLAQTAESINFNNALWLHHAQWLADSTPPGGVAELLTIWQVIDPARVGPRVPPANATDAKLFSHILAADGTIIAQQDLLSVPSWQWQSGDIILQVHQIWIGPEIESGLYETAVGLYSESTAERLPIVGQEDGRAFVPPLHIGPLP